MIDNLDRDIQVEVKKILATKYLLKKNKGLHFISRTLDIIFSIILLVIFSPIILAVSLIIFSSNGAPVFFRQIRVGVNGMPFHIIKFRTMRKDAEIILKEDNELYEKYLENDYKLPPDEDPRLIKFGNFLRKSSLDELPQLFCVLKGDMSLVGPRPIVPNEIERYEGYERQFLSVKPGITGLWQVSGRSDIEYPQRKYLDLLYVENQSLLLDFKILFKTIFIVLKRSGAH